MTLTNVPKTIRAQPFIPVMKFGGTSVGHAGSLETAVRLAASETECLPLVVSAVSGVTDWLAELAEATRARGGMRIDAAPAAVRERHLRLSAQASLRRYGHDRQS